MQTAGNGGGQHDDGAIQAHLDLQVALRSAVVGVSAGRDGDEGVGHRAAGRRLLRQQALCTPPVADTTKPGNRIEVLPAGVGQTIRQRDRDRLPFRDNQRRAREPAS